METCGILTTSKDVFGEIAKCECVRPWNHVGEHAVRAKDNRLWAFWTDITCDCEACQSSEPEDWCEFYTEITPEEMKQLCESSELVIYDV